MTTIATIAAEYNIRPRELAAFLDISQGTDHEKELDGEEAQNIIDLLEYDRTYCH